jgi:hypothetical protein
VYLALANHKRSFWIAGTMMEGTDHDEMSRGSSSFQQNSANCKFESIEAAFSIAVGVLCYSRRFVYESYGGASEKDKVNIGSCFTERLTPYEALGHLESSYLLLRSCWAFSVVL